MLEAKSGAGVAEGVGDVAGAVVGHHARDGDAEAGVVGDGRFQEGGGAVGGLVGQDLAEGHAGVIVDADVDELPADAAAVALSGSVAGHAVAGLFETAELLDVEVDHFAWRLALVADDGCERVQVPGPAQLRSPQDAAHRGRRDPGIFGDLLAGEALAAKGDDPVHRLRRGRPVQPARSRRPILQARRTFRFKTLHPLPNRLGVDAEGRGHGLRGPGLNQDPPHHLASTVQRQPGILVHVHPTLA